MVSFGLGENGRAFDESKRLAKILEAIRTLDALGVVEQVPVRCLRVKAGGLLPRQRRNAATARRATFFGECYWHRCLLGAKGYHG